MRPIALDELRAEAREFAERLSRTPLPDLYGITDGKAIGTYVELRFQEQLRERYPYVPGSAGIGVDIPELDVDVKCTFIGKPQSSSPYRSARQKIYGLGHSLLVFVYSKIDDSATRAATLEIVRLLYVPRELTADYQTTHGLREILRREGNRDDIMAFLEERNLPLDAVGREQLADEILANPPALGFLTVSNALQWRLQFGRAISHAVAGDVPGLEDLLA